MQIDQVDIPEGSFAFFKLTKHTAAMKYWVEQYGIPVIEDPKEMQNYDTILFSFISWREFFKVSSLYKYKGATEWVGGGPGVQTPSGIVWFFDYLMLGDAFLSFPNLLRGERDLPGLFDCKNPKPVYFAVEEILDAPLNNRDMVVSKGCPKKCLFCVSGWRRPYQEASIDAVKEFIDQRVGKGTGVMMRSNSYDDLSYHEELTDYLHDNGINNGILSNSVKGLTDNLIEKRRGAFLFGVEGMSERLRSLMKKPISQEMYRERMINLLEKGKNIRCMYQFNLPGETMIDWEEFLSDVEHITRAVGKGSWAITFGPNQPTSNTPLQWCKMKYSNEMLEKLIDFRKNYGMGNSTNGVKINVPQMLFSKGWCMQVLADWLPVNYKLILAFKKMKNNRPSLPEVVKHLRKYGIESEYIFAEKGEDYVFPWDAQVIPFRPKKSLRKAYEAMQKMIASFPENASDPDESSIL